MRLVQDPQQTFIFNIVLAGSSGAGKTRALLKLIEKNLKDSEEPKTTIGADFKVKTVYVDGKRVKLNIWDTAGQEEFQTFCGMYYKEAQGVLVFYDISDKKSFDKVVWS